MVGAFPVHAAELVHLIDPFANCGLIIKKAGLRTKEGDFNWEMLLPFCGNGWFGVPGIVE
jgi:hypothetical protein